MTGRITVRNGYWHCVINYKDEFGRYKQKWINTNLKERGNKKFAKELLDKEIEIFKKQLKDEQGNSKVSNDILFVDWVKRYIENKKSTLTKVVFDSYLRKIPIIKKFFGNKLKLKDVSHTHIESFFAYLKQERNNKNITVKHYAVVIYPALKEAYKNDLIVKNPVDFIAPIKKERSRQKYYNKEEMQQLFEASKGHRCELAIKVAAYYGFRRSELLGLKWESVDFNNKTITVENKVLVLNKEIISTDVLKTTSSYRTLPLLPEIEKDLILHKQKIEDNKMFFGRVYNNEFSDYVFVDEAGNLLLPDYLTKSMQDIIKAHNLKKIRLHDLRHSCASLLLSSGVSMKQIQEWLGHSNFATTADIYSHLDFDSKIDAANKLSQTLNFEKPETPKQKSTEELLQEIENLKQELNKHKKQQDIEM